MKTLKANTQTGFSRRAALATGAGAITSAAAVSASAAATAKPSLTGPYLDLTTGQGNMLAMARIVGDLDLSKQKHGWYRGVAMGFRPGEAGRDLFGVMGMGTGRLIPMEDKPGFTNVRRECGYYYDLESGEVLDTWVNPYTNEEVEVLHIANPQINAPLEPVVRGATLYDDPVEAEKAAQPFLLDWQIAGDLLFAERHAHLYAKNPLDPEVWVRESAGPMIRITDSTSYMVSLADMQNPDLTTISETGKWVHVRPWQPFMLMGDAPGHFMFRCFTGSASSLDDMPADIVSVVQDRNPDFLNAPTEIKPSVPGMVRFMRDRTPAPPRKTEG
ncbi:MAG: DUF1838 family protein [Rhodospirillaceae bacterium]